MTPWQKVLTAFDAPKRVYLVLGGGQYLGAFTSEENAVRAAVEFAPEYPAGTEVWVDEVDNPVPVARKLTTVRAEPVEIGSGGHVEFARG